ncbi:phospholipase D-like domain-containing protein, partial [Chromobacterium amazonense]|uniref:phospholipase D-like domain-containing protein n=1 Tax=Chromobacterium amazonense TaxID=1382803 RepID=UPI00237DD705
RLNRTEVELRQNQLDRSLQLVPSAYASKAKMQAYQQQKQVLEAKQAALQARKQQLSAQKTALEKGDAPILPEERPGLKVHVCTLVAPDSEPTTPDGKKVRLKYPMSAESYTVPGRDWTPVYIHSKLLIVNDSFMTLGSANINTRSMQVDSELNIAHHRPEITQPLRRHLWHIHTNGRGAQDKPADAFREWKELIRDNKIAKNNWRSPMASLVEFSRLSASRTNKD